MDDQTALRVARGAADRALAAIRPADLARSTPTGRPVRELADHLRAATADQAGPDPRWQVLELVVHTWDLNRAIGVDDEPANDVLGHTVRLARELRPHAAPGLFADPIAVPGCTDDLTELLALTGRHRWWRA